MKKYEPLHDRVLVRLIKPEEGQKTEGGIITDTIAKPIQEAEVVAAGTGCYAFETGVFMPNILVKGDRVIVPFNHGMPIDTDEEKDLRVMREGDVLLVVKKSTDN